MCAQWRTLVIPARTRATMAARRQHTRSHRAAMVCRLRGRARPCRGPAMALPVHRPAWPAWQTGRSSAGRPCGEVPERNCEVCWAKRGGLGQGWLVMLATEQLGLSSEAVHSRGRRIASAVLEDILDVACVFCREVPLLPWFAIVDCRDSGTSLLRTYAGTLHTIQIAAGVECTWA